MAKKRMSLPANIALTDRSRKFYDGTYTLVSDGFKDEKGVYRDFDCFDPESRAPTPLPPMHLGDDDLNTEEYHITPSRSVCGGVTTPSQQKTSQVAPQVVSPQAMGSTNIIHGQVHTPLRKNGAFKALSPSSPSDLSDCPSDISDWDVAKQDPNQGVAARILNEPKRRSSTRGVAQKVKKGAKKVVSDNSSGDLPSLQTGSYMTVGSTGSRRRSTRRANAL